MNLMVTPQRLQHHQRHIFLSLDRYYISLCANREIGAGKQLSLLAAACDREILISL